MLVIHCLKIASYSCHLLLGEFQEAMLYYNSCLESGNDVCLDRRIIIEAADGLQKAQVTYIFLFDATILCFGYSIQTSLGILSSFLSEREGWVVMIMDGGYMWCFCLFGVLIIESQKKSTTV